MIGTRLGGTVAGMRWLPADRGEGGIHHIVTTHTHLLEVPQAHRVILGARGGQVQPQFLLLR
jgi:hypothetical protein